MTFADLSGLPSVSFAPQSAGETETAIITAYEAIAKATLQPGDPVRLFLESLAYILSVQNGLIDLAGKQNLLAYARGGHLDHLGAPMGVIRIQPQPARTTVRFGVDGALAFAVPIPAGTRVTTQSGGVMFATLSDAVLPAGELFVETSAKATEAGASGNGLLPGQICRLVDPLPYITRVSNVATTLSGCDEEGDERFRDRIRMAPESFSVAGPNGAYEARVKAVSADISAVSVTSPTPGVVDIRFVLTDGELPDEAMIEEVENALTPKDVRPLTDTVLVGSPETVEEVVPVVVGLHAAGLDHEGRGRGCGGLPPLAAVEAGAGHQPGRADRPDAQRRGQARGTGDTRFPAAHRDADSA